MRVLRTAGLLGLSLSLACLGGCHSMHAPAPEAVQCCKTLPRCCRDHVHVFILHGMDPVNCANLTGLREYFIDLGFNNTSFGQLYHGGRFANEIRRIHKADPQARFVVVGFSFGANAARTLVSRLHADEISIDLLVYLGGNTLKNVPADRPANAHRIINVLAKGCIWNGAQIDDAENLNLPDVYHFGSPTHPATMEMFAQELSEVASRVQIVEDLVEAKKPLLPTKAGWEYLAPRATLEPASDVERK